MQVELQAFLDYLRVECGLADRTLEAYSHDVRRFFTRLEEFEVKALTNVTTDHVISHMIALRGDGLKPPSVARALAALRMFFRFLLGEGMIPADPTDRVEAPAKWHRQPIFLTAAEVERLLAAPEARKLKSKRLAVDDPFGLRDRAILEVLYATGARVSEVSDLKPESVNLDVGYLRVRGKGTKERIVPLGRPAISRAAGTSRISATRARSS